jgi:hypothetical protein
VWGILKASHLGSEIQHPSATSTAHGQEHQIISKGGVAITPIVAERRTYEDDPIEAN